MSIDKDDLARFRAKIAMHARCIDDAICAAQNEITDELRTMLQDSGSDVRASTVHVVYRPGDVVGTAFSVSFAGDYDFHDIDDFLGGA